MPLGKWKNFDQCVIAQKRDGKSDISARKICGAIEQNMRQASTNVKYEDKGGHLYIKAFLLDASVNINEWGVNPTSLDQKINTFIGKPLVLTSDFRHPMPPEMHRVGAEEYDNDDDPYNTVKVDEIVDHWLQYQEIYRVGSIIDITEKNGTYYAIIEVTDDAAKDAFRNNDVPLFVSPAIAQLDPLEDAANISNWTGIHLAIVSEPAYTIKKALVTSQCHDEKDRCLLQLRQAAIEKNEIPRLGCGFCRWDTLARYAEIVKSWRTKHSVVIKNTKNPNDFLNSSFGFSKTNSNLVEELSDQQQNQQTSNNNQNDINNNNQQQKDNPQTTTKVAEEEKEETNNKEIPPQPKTAVEEVAIKVAGMAECVQIFQQNGVQDPQQAQQICKLAAQALMEGQQNQQPPGGSGGQQQGAPRGTGQFGSVTEYEKELAKYEMKIAQLTDELKAYKKTDKTDAQRIAELEETVTNLNKAYKEKEFEAYLVASAKLEDQDFIQKKVKRFAELNLTLDDIKDIYPPKEKSNNSIKKVAEVISPPSPISKVKLQVASTTTQQSGEGESQDTKTVNEVRERNNRILSSLLSKGGIY